MSKNSPLNTGIHFLCPLCLQKKNNVKSYVGVLLGASIPSFTFPLCPPCSDDVQNGKVSGNKLAENARLFGFTATAYRDSLPCHEWNNSLVADNLIDELTLAEKIPSMVFKSGTGIFIVWFYGDTKPNDLDSVIILRNINFSINHIAGKHRKLVESTARLKNPPIPLTNMN
jgi:hypothetical protein